MRLLLDRRRMLLAGLTALALVATLTASFFIGRGGTAARAAGAQFTTARLADAGSGMIGSGASVAADGATSLELGPNVDTGDDDGDTGAAPAPGAPTTAPNPAGNALTGANPGFAGFAGLNHFQNRTASGGNQFSLEPPDQGLCVGNGFVVEPVNDVIAVYDPAGHTLSGPTALNAFFGLAPSIIRGVPNGFGPFLSDPKCYFDQATGRFFVTILEIDTNPANGADANNSAELIAVSQTSDPTGVFHFFKLDTTDDGTNGTPSHPGCPCFGDQPLIGADANGFYISSNEFSIHGPQFVGAQIYAMSKRALVAGTAPVVVHIDVSQVPKPAPDGPAPWRSIQPATTPPGDDADAEGGDGGQNGGTEFFLSRLNFTRTLDNRIAVWALTNTGSLDDAAPSVVLADTIVASETYGQPPNAVQKAGPTPLRDLIATPGNPVTGTAVANPIERLAGNDDRMNQVVFAAGHLWGELNTVVQAPGSPARVGAAFFVVKPQFKDHTLTARMDNQGYVSVDGENVLYPSIGVTADGKAIMTLSLAGPDFFPSAAYVPISLSHGAGQIHIAAAGVGPDDGFSGYRPFAGGATGRWGDYSAAVADEHGTIWLAQEYIGQSCTDAQFTAADGFTCGGTRTQLANWGTFISSVNPEADDN